MRSRHIHVCNLVCATEIISKSVQWRSNRVQRRRKLIWNDTAEITGLTNSSRISYSGQLMARKRHDDIIPLTGVVDEDSGGDTLSN